MEYMEYIYIFTFIILVTFRSHTVCYNDAQTTNCVCVSYFQDSYYRIKLPIQSEANNKPCEERLDAEKHGGYAAQNWCILSLIPLMLGDRIKTPAEDDVWQLCLKLRDVVDLIRAPKIHTNQVTFLRF